MIFVFSVLVYIISLIAISLKLRDIIKNPQKYEETKLQSQAYALERRKNHFGFFKSLSHQYAFVPLMFAFALTALFGVLLYDVTKLIAGNNILLLPGTWGIGVVSMYFFSLTFGLVIIPLHIKTPFFAVAVDGMYDGDRYDIWKKGYISFLIAFALCFPFFALSANNYIYFNDTGLTTSAYFEIGETYTAYEDIEEIWISAHHNKSGQPSSLNYEVKLSDGKILDLCTTTYYNKKTLDIHKILESKANCKVNIEPLTAEDIEYLTENTSRENLDIIKYIFEGFH